MIEPTRAVSLFIDAGPGESFMREDVKQALAAVPPSLPPKYFYDERGSGLFDAICRLPEYYPTRTETAIMQASIGQMKEAVGPGALLVEYGSGSSTKTEILLSHLEQLAGYVPIDISREHLLASAERIVERHPGVPVYPVAADYTKAIPGLEPLTRKHRSVVYFPGSTIGNFQPEEARSFLEQAARLVGPGGGMLIGVDLRKSRRVLEAAYDDAQGVTAQFNKNILAHINRELGPVFDLSAWRHRAVWNDEASRVEMHLVAERDQTITLDNLELTVSAGDALVTEHSYKYSLASFERLASSAGFETQNTWTDSEQLFSVHYLVARN